MWRCVRVPISQVAATADCMIPTGQTRETQGAAAATGNTGSSPRLRRSYGWLERYNTGITLLAAGLVFVVDRLAPPYVVVSPLYVVVVLLSLWAPRTRDVHLA